MKIEAAIMHDKLTTFVVQPSSYTIHPELLVSGIMPRLLASPMVSVTIINSLEPAKVTMAEHMHLLTSPSHIIVITFDSFSTTAKYLRELNIAGELIDTGNPTVKIRSPKTPMRRIFLACVHHTSDIQEVESGISKALIVAKDILNSDLADKATGLPVVKRDGRKNQIGHPSSPTLFFGNRQKIKQNEQVDHKANSTPVNISDFHIESLLNELDNADL